MRSKRSGNGNQKESSPAHQRNLLSSRLKEDTRVLMLMVSTPVRNLEGFLCTFMLVVQFIYNM